MMTTKKTAEEVYKLNHPLDYVSYLKKLIIIKHTIDTSQGEVKDVTINYLLGYIDGAEKIINNL